MSERIVIRTEAAPAPFQGAPYSQAIRNGDLVFVSGQLGLKPGDDGDLGHDPGADGADLPEPEGDSRGGRERPRPDRQDDGLPHRSRQLPGDERGLRAARRARTARRARPSRSRRCPRARSSRSRRSRQSELVAADRGLRARARARRLRRRRRRARRAARASSRRTPTSSCSASTTTSCARCSSRTGASRISRSRASASACGSSRATARSASSRLRESSSRRRGASAAPARDGTTSRSSSTPSASVEDDLAPARLHGERDRAPALATASSSIRSAARRTSRTASCARSRRARSREDPLRTLRGLRLVSQFDLAPDDETSRQMRRGGRRTSGSSRPSGSAAGCRPTGWGSCRSCCSARRPRRRCGSRATPACCSRSSPSSSRSIGHDADNVRQGGPVDEHVFKVVAAAPRSLPVRLAALLHDLGKPLVDVARARRGGRAHRRPRARAPALPDAAPPLRRRARRARTRSRPTTSTSCSHAASCASTASELARDLVAHKEADLRAKNVDERGARAHAAAARAARAGGVEPAPAVRPRGRRHRTCSSSATARARSSAACSSGLLDDVVDDPSRNEREWLLERAKEQLA